MSDYDIPDDGITDGTAEAIPVPRPLPGPIPRPLPFPWPPVPLPILIGVSGRYGWRAPKVWPGPGPIPIPFPFDPIPKPIDPPGPRPAAEADDAGFIPLPWWQRQSETLRLDVDGRYPQMTVSGTIHRPLRAGTHWIAALTETATDTWSGAIWFTHGQSLPYTTVTVTAKRSLIPANRRVTVRFIGGGGTLTRTYRWQSKSFRDVEFEFDTVAGASPVFEIGTHDHPDRPSSMADEQLSVADIFERAGFAVSGSGGDGAIPLAEAGTDARWTDAEMHDAMQVYWSRFADKPQWSMWVLAAQLHQAGTSLGGVMFDDIGPNHRQGTALFTDSFIAQAPAGDSAPTAWVRRMKLWTAVHEMGHAFNLAHSWQKSLGTPWITLADEPEARSFMNYPYFVSGGQKAFFADFEYRFSDGELLFMRHAPEAFVEMGNADWFEDHGLRQQPHAPRLAVRLRAERADRTYQFLEPVRVAASLVNTSDAPALVDGHALDDGLLVVRRAGGTARPVRPFARYFAQGRIDVLEPGMAGPEEIRLVSAGAGGWQITEPGDYTIRMVTTVDGELLISNAVRVRILPPAGYDEQVLAQDIFTDDVARVLRFGGSRCLGSANATLEAVRTRLPERRIAVHAGVALGLPLLRPFRTLDFGEAARDTLAAPRGKPAFTTAPADVERARALLKPLIEDAGAAVETLGREVYGAVSGQAVDALRAADEGPAADRLEAVASAVSGDGPSE